MDNPNFPQRIWTNYFTTAANASEQTFEFDTEDDYRTRYIRTLFVGLATAGIKLGFKAQGTDYSYVDLSRFAAGDPVVKVNIEVPPVLKFSITLTDINGSAHTHVPVVIGYGVDPSQGR